MRRTVQVLAGTVALAAPTTSAVAQAATQQTATTKIVTRRVVGAAAQADRWGDVQVTLVVKKTTTTVGAKTKVTRRIIRAAATYPDHTDRSIFINQQAIPWLTQEVLKAQFNSNINLISGATDTSYAFVQSLQSAILKAKAL